MAVTIAVTGDVTQLPRVLKGIYRASFLRLPQIGETALFVRAGYGLRIKNFVGIVENVDFYRRTYDVRIRRQK